MIPSKTACACGKPASLNRSGRLMCKPCAQRAAGKALAVDPDVTEADPLLARKREAEGEAFQVLVMETGHRKARADWREKYADLLPVDSCEESGDDSAHEEAEHGSIE